MKATFNSKELLKQVQSVGSLINPSAPVPILKTVLFSFENQKLQIVADNLEVRSCLDVQVEFFGNYFTCIPYALLNTVLKAFPDGPVEFEFDDKEVTLRSDNGGEYKIPVENATDFPKPKIDETGDKIQFNSMELLESLKKALSFTGTDPLLWVYSVLIWITDEGTRIVGGTNQAVYEEKIDVKGKEVQLLLTRNTVAYLINAIHTEEVIELSYIDNKAYFNLEGRQITAVLSNAKWPAYHKLFDLMQNDKKFIIDKDTLIPPLTRLSSVAVNRSSIINFNFEGDSLELAYSNSMLQYGARENIKIDYTGGSIASGFPADQFLNVMKFTDGDGPVVMELSEEKKPCLITQDGRRCLIAAMKPVE